MKEIVARYMRKFLSQFFLSYPDDQIEFVCDVLPAVESVLLQDFRAKHPKLVPLDSLSSKFFELMQVDAGLEATFLYRLEHAIFKKDTIHPILPFLAGLMRLKTGVELYYSNEIGPGLNVQHGSGIVLGPRNRIGSGFVIHQGVTFGQRVTNAPTDGATVGDNVTVYAGAKVIGPIRIGSNSQIAANAVVLHDVEADSVYGGVPARRIGTIR